MKVSGPNRAGSTASVKRSGRVSGPATGGFNVEETDETKQTARVAAPQALAAVDSLIALQEVDEQGTSRRKEVKRAGDMLDLLEEIRMGLITSGVPIGKLNNLVRLVEGRRDGFGDPKLTELIDEIELRARVEIAKWWQNQE